MHTGDRVQDLAAAWVGDMLSVCAQVTRNYEKKGHRFVDIDAPVMANRDTPIARIAHTTIYRLRQAAAT